MFCSEERGLRYDLDSEKNLDMIIICVQEVKRVWGEVTGGRQRVCDLHAKTKPKIVLGDRYTVPALLCHPLTLLLSWI